MTDWPTLTKALQRTMAVHVPEWTDRNASDPGTILVELIAYALDGLDHRQEPIAVTVAGRRWQRVSTLARAQPDEPVFELNEDTGTIRFGDGVHGRRPPPGTAITAHWRHGSGEQRTTIVVRATWPLTNRAHRITERQDGTVQAEPCTTMDRLEGAK